jgi:hypothetical protein
MTMFEGYFGYWKLAKNVAALLNEILKSAPDNLSFVRIEDDKVIVTNGEQILRMDIDDREQAPKSGLYVMAGTIFVPVLNAALLKSYPDVDPSLDYGNFSKTAKIDVPAGTPMIAMSYLIQEFGATLPLDAVSAHLKRLFAFKPEYIRAYGHANKDVAVKSPVKIEALFVDESCRTFSAPVAVEYLMAPLSSKKEDFVQVDAQPLLFEVKQAS